VYWKREVLLLVSEGERGTMLLSSWNWGSRPVKKSPEFQCAGDIRTLLGEHERIP
jgi:hypothetical protein